MSEEQRSAIEANKKAVTLLGYLDDVLAKLDQLQVSIDVLDQRAQWIEHEVSNASGKRGVRGRLERE